MYCHKCGAPLMEGANFCSVCGASIKDAPKSKPAEKAAPTAAPKPKIVKEKKERPPKPIKAKKESPAKKTSSKKTLRIAVISGAAFLVLAIGAVVTGYLIVNSRYRNADEGMAANPSEAKESFLSISWYKDSAQKAEDCQKSIDYSEALTRMRSGDYQSAREMFLELGSYRDSKSYAEECQKNWDYYYLSALMDQGQYQQALDGFTELGKFKDSVELAVICLNSIRYEEALSFMDVGNYGEAREIFGELNGFADSDELADECQNHIIYFEAEAEFDAGNNFNAYMLFGCIRDFSDAAQRQEECILETPPASELSRNPNFSSQTCPITIVAPREELMLHTYLKIYSEHGELVTTLFIPRGEQLKIKLPSGTYIFKTGYGWDWFGEKDAFGENGQYSVLLFEGSSETWKLSSGYTYTLTLMPEGSGNIGGRNEDLGDF